MLRPPGHRAPVIAAGAVLLTIGLGLLELRLNERLEVGVHLLILGGSGSFLLAIGVQYRTEGGQPLGSASVLIVCGLLVSLGALLRLAELSAGDEDVGSGAMALVSAAFAALAAWPATRRRSAAAALLSAFGAVAFLLFAYDKLFDPSSTTPFRWLLLALTIGLILVSLVLRGSRLRHATVLVCVAGMCIAAIGAIALVDGFSLFAFDDDPIVGFFGGVELGGFWKFLMIVAACGSIAVGVVDRQPGPVLIGMVNAAFFITIVGVQNDDSLRWWPLVLLLGGLAAIAFGLRPRAPLPPEPGYEPVPLAARSVDADPDGELTIRVRDESPPS